MFRKTLNELLEMLKTYEDILGKNFIDEINSCKENPYKLKEKLNEKYEKISFSSFSRLTLERRERLDTLTKILYAAINKIKIS